MDKIDRRTDTQQASGGKDRWIDNGDTRCINNHTSLKDDISQYLHTLYQIFKTLCYIQTQ